MSFHSAAQILERIAPELIVSKQRLRQLENIELVRLKRDHGQKSLAFTSRPFVLCGLPVRRPPAGQLLYERRNGSFVLQITGHPNFGLPFGQDRLVPIFLATLAVRQKSQTIRFRSGAEMLDTFGMAKGGKEYRRLMAAFERIFGATMFFGSDGQTAKARVVHRARFNFLREATIWYERRSHDRLDDEPFENVITLSDEFYREIMAHPIPTDLDIVKILAPSPAVLDLFVWLSYRYFTAKGTESIPLFGELIKSGRLRVLATTGTRRSAFHPQVPTFTEAGYPGVVGQEWFALFAPAGTPRPAVADLAVSVKKLVTR